VSDLADIICCLIQRSGQLCGIERASKADHVRVSGPRHYHRRCPWAFRRRDPEHIQGSVLSDHLHPHIAGLISGGLTGKFERRRADGTDHQRSRHGHGPFRRTDCQDWSDPLGAGKQIDCHIAGLLGRPPPCKGSPVWLLAGSEPVLIDIVLGGDRGYLRCRNHSGRRGNAVSASA
jgi:hypothetical protein